VDNTQWEQSLERYQAMSYFLAECDDCVASRQHAEMNDNHSEHSNASWVSRDKGKPLASRSDMVCNNNHQKNNPTSDLTVLYEQVNFFLPSLASVQQTK
jgi:hypothetical protein